MRPRVLALLLPLLLAGCTFGGGGGGESSEDGQPVREPDYANYQGGPGMALAVRNDGSDPFAFDLVVKDDNGTEKAVFSDEVAPGTTAEAWWSLPAQAYDVTFDYEWRNGSSLRTGDDERRVELRGCDLVTRVEWRLVQTDTTVGAAFTGASCTQRP